MREFKFRAWDLDRKQMMRVLSIEWLDAVYVSYWNEQGVARANNILMQYTWLKDKNGKEIYEGDIITCSAYQREQEEIAEGTKVVVTYSSGYFYPFWYNAGRRSEVYDSEVIGNIYENPELIN